MMDISYVYIKVVFLLLVFSDVLMGVVVTRSFSKEGETAIIECSYSSGQTLNVLSWYRANEVGEQIGDPLVSSDTLSLNDRYSLNTTGDSSYNMYITGITKADAGNYRCNVVFTGGVVEHDVADLTVQYLDVPSVTAPSTPVLADSATTLYCSLPDGVPTEITFSWMKDGVWLDIANNDRLSGSVNNQNLTINIVNSNDTGDYRCRAENAVFSGSDGRTSANVNLEVNYVTLTKMEWIGGRITCMAEGNPTPRVSIEADRSVVVSETGTASTDISCDTSSTVRCVLDNGVNQEVSETFVGCDDACTSNPCLNAGVCMSSNDDDFSCDCASGFKGTTCQDETGSSAGLIAGVIIAVIAVIVIIVVVFLYCRKKKEKTPESNAGYSAKPADVEMSGEPSSRQPLKTGDEPSKKSGLGVNKDLQKSNEMLFDAREDAGMYNKDGGKAVGVMI